MKTFETIKTEKIKFVLKGLIIGFLVGLVIKYINFFGHSQNAPFICAITCCYYNFMRFEKENNK